MSPEQDPRIASQSHGRGPEPWPLLESKAGPHLMVSRVRFDTMRNPRNGEELVRTVLEVPEWVNVIALTPGGRLVVVRQFRFGPAEVTCEVPGGLVDPGEDHETAGRRELREESGYSAPRWSYLGSVQPNPAFHDNRCHHWLAEGAERTHELDQDIGEDIVVDTLSPDEVRGAIRSGEMRHALVISALSRIFDLRMRLDIEGGSTPMEGQPWD